LNTPRIPSIALLVSVAAISISAWIIRHLIIAGSKEAKFTTVGDDLVYFTNIAIPTLALVALTLIFLVFRFTKSSRVLPVIACVAAACAGLLWSYARISKTILGYDEWQSAVKSTIALERLPNAEKTRTPIN